MVVKNVVSVVWMILYNMYLSNVIMLGSCGGLSPSALAFNHLGGLNMCSGIGYLGWKQRLKILLSLVYAYLVKYE